MKGHALVGLRNAKTTRLVKHTLQIRQIIVYFNKQKLEKSSKLGKILFFRWYLGHVCCKCLKRIAFCSNVDQFETMFRAGAPPHAEYVGRGITYKKGGEFAGHGSCMVVECAISPVPSLFAFWRVLRKVWVRALICDAVKVVWRRAVLVEVVLCVAGMTEVWLAVTWTWS